MPTTDPASDRPLRGRRISADEFYKITGRRLKATNDNVPAAKTEKDAA